MTYLRPGYTGAKYYLEAHKQPYILSDMKNMSLESEKVEGIWGGTGGVGVRMPQSVAPGLWPSREVKKIPSPAG